MEYSRVFQIYNMLTPKPHDLVHKGRFYVREGYLRMWKDSKQKFKKRYCFLFNDVMLLCKKEGPLSTKKYWLRIHITLRSPHCRVEEKENSYNNDFMLHCRSRSFRFQVDSQNLKSSWMEDIRKSITGEHEENQKDVEKSRDALLKGDLSLSNVKATPSEDEDEYYETDSSEMVETPQVDNSRTKISDKTKKKKPAEKKESNNNNDSFLLIDIPSSNTSYDNSGAFGQTGSTNPFDAIPGFNQTSQVNNTPIFGQTTSSANPFTSTPTTTSNHNPFLTQTAPAPVAQNNNPFLSGGVQAPVQSNESSYNPFMAGGSVPTQEKQSENYNPFMCY